MQNKALNFRYLNSFLLLLCFLLGSNSFLYSQNGNIGGDAVLNAVTVSVPFLIISPDARAGGMGDLGVATSADANSMHWNVAKLARVNKDMSFNVSYTPWLKNLVPDINLAYLGFYKKLNDRFTLGTSLRYFSLGDIMFTTEIGTQIGVVTPHEFAFDVGGSLKLSDYWSTGVAFRFIYSNLTLGQNSQGLAIEPGIAGAGDFGFYYENSDKKLFDRPVTWRFGTTFQNIGSKIRYSAQQSNADWIPVMFRIGGSASIEIDDYNSFSFSLETSKLLVPTPPFMKGDTIIAGQDRNRSVMLGMVTSLWDAPGGFDEEMREFVWSAGAEYWYDKTLAVRTGFFYEHPTKGSRQYFTVGAGLRYNVFGLDFSYLFPIGGIANNPLANTLRFSLSFNLDRIAPNNASKPLPTN
jgi:hypothetical protein